ncbi:MAG: hypothetical protein WB810_09240 [Candidatus Cybelea sp.]
MILLAILLALAQSSTELSIQPWTGSDLQTTTERAAKYRLKVSGKPKTTLRLQARGVAQGWLAAFCTPRLCSPQRVELTLPESGASVVQFELIRESENAPERSSATIVSQDGASVYVPAASRR